MYLLSTEKKEIKKDAEKENTAKHVCQEPLLMVRHLNPQEASQASIPKQCGFYIIAH